MLSVFDKHPKQLRSIEKTLHPMDELDKERVDALKTVYSCMPKGFKAEHKPPSTPPKTMQAFLDTVSDEEETQVMQFHREAKQRLLDAVECSSGSARQIALGNVEVYEGWEQLVHSFATVVMASVGDQSLQYVKCYREERRQQLIAKRLPEQTNLVAVVKVAVRMAKDGLLPPVGERGRKTEFLKRCMAALKKANPFAETDAKKFPKLQQNMLALALDSTSRLCIRCAEPAEIAASFNQWTCVWEMQDGINIPEVEVSKLWCKGCFREARPVNCPMCGKEDALEDTGDNLAVKAGLFWILFGRKCRRWCDDSGFGWPRSLIFSCGSC